MHNFSLKHIARLTLITLALAGLFAMSCASAAPPVYYGSIVVPAAGRATLSAAALNGILCTDASQNITTTACTPDLPYHIFHIKDYGACGGGDQTVNLQAAYVAAAAVTGNQITGAKVVYDCSVTVSGTGGLPIAITGYNVVTEGGGNYINVTSGYNGDLFLKAASPITHGLAFRNFTVLYNSAQTSGAMIDLKSCDGCTIDHVFYTGAPFDLVDVGATTTQTVRSYFNDIRGISGANYRGCAFRMNGPGGNIIASNWIVYGGGVSSTSESVCMNDASVGFDPNWDAFWFVNDDFELVGHGFDFAMNYGLLNDVFIISTICDGPNAGPCLKEVATGAGIIHRIMITTPWFGGNGGSQDGISLSQSGGGSIFDNEITGGGFVSGGSASGNGLNVGAGVGATFWRDVSIYNSGGCGVLDNGIGTNVSSSKIGSLVNGGGARQAGNNTGICVGAAAVNPLYAANDLLGNTSGPVTISASATSVVMKDNVGYSPTLNGATCALAYATQNGAQTCLTATGQIVGSSLVVAAGSASSCTGGMTYPNGIMVISGVGVPTCTAAKGSLYLRTDGSSGAQLYVSAGAGSWTAVAGV